jgi:DNA-binding response OmpR family regulator
MPITTTSEGCTPSRIAVLAVLPKEEDCRSLCSILERSNWTVRTATTVAEALSMLKDSFAPVILCERDLPDGNWKDLLEAVADREQPPFLVVTSRLADDHLWAEVLNLGGFDVLPMPFDPREMFRVLSMAWRQWHDRKGLSGCTTLVMAG